MTETLPHPPMGPDAPWLAPLAGYSDLAFRLLCREYGAAVACTEMVSVKGLVYSRRLDSGTWALLKTCPEDTPLVVQLFGDLPDFMERATAMLLEHGSTYFDINAGCSVRKVAKTGSGAALLCGAEDRARLVDMTNRMARLAGPGKVGVKFRLGWDEEIFIDLGKRLEDAGAGWLTLHPRTAKQGFGGQARWAAVAELVQAVSIPVLVSGDLFTAEDGQRAMAETKAAGVMFARGAMRRPTIFNQWRALMAGKPATPPTPAELIGIIRRHAELSREYGNVHTTFLKMRTFVPRYLKDLAHARALRRRVVSCTSWQELHDLLDEALNMEHGMEQSGQPPENAPKHPSQQDENSA